MKPADFSMTSTIRYIWVIVVLCVLPCAFFHFKLIFATILPSSAAKGDFIAANLAFGALMYIFSTASNIAEIYYYFYSNDFACGFRALHYRLGLTIVTLTLPKIVENMRKSLDRNPLYENINPNRSWRTVIIINTVAVVTLLLYAFARSYDAEQRKCVKEFLLDSVWIDWVARCVVFLVLEAIPASMLFRELVKVISFFENYRRAEDIEFEQFVKRKRLRMLKTIFIFSSLYFFCSVPVILGDISNSPGIEWSTNIKYYRAIIIPIVCMLTFILVNIIPVYLCFSFRSESDYNYG